MTSLCFLWHMHQPFYKDLWTGQYKLPWTRFHALKDYAGMVRILGEFPQIHQTFNLVPSMVAQIEDYASGRASDAFFECAVTPAEELTGAQRTFVLRYFFQANEDHLIRRYPRYWDLFVHRHELPEHGTIRDLRDLQILSQLVWFDEDLLAKDQELQELIRKGHDFSLADQEMLEGKQKAALAGVLLVYREFAALGQIEISTTPFYHPILPLLCDSDIAAVAHPGVTLPPRFQYPDDAHEQLLRARSYMREKLGVAPVGLWPSEGSVSDEALALAANCGFTWAASDNGVLSRTLGRVAGIEETYRAYVWERDGRNVRLLFRDRYLSDLIGFEYSRMSAADAAGHFLHKIFENTGGHDVLVPVILDGENAWEWYEANGRPFLRELYRRISEDPGFEALTVSEALARYERHPLKSVAPGSWINANFDIWIGAEEDNRAWSLLLDARRAYDQHAAAAPEDGRLLAFEELLIAEGSDWCWWYGPEHGSDNRPDFDELYRDHLSNVYRALGLTPPAELARPILQDQLGEVRERPANALKVTLDGEVTTSFEWMGAGRYRPDARSGAMHGGGPAVREMFYGTDGSHLFVRLDGADGAAFGVEFEGGPVAAEVVRGRIVELQAPLAGQRFRVVIERDGLAAVRVPGEGWLELG
ncbi:MAG TPA: glycoside hydrolase family 57 protein [Bryobacteraceae bacterium]|nr:glycoside hydrolase family 57 protein [Bryobacteraceae bacterium]